MIAFKVKAKAGIWLQEESFHGVAFGRSMDGEHRGGQSGEEVRKTAVLHGY